MAVQQLSLLARKVDFIKIILNCKRPKLTSMLKHILSVFLIIFCSTSYSQNLVYNVDGENIVAGAKIPKGWLFGFDDDQRQGYHMVLDQELKQSGKHSISIEKKTILNTFGPVTFSNKSPFAAITFPIHKTFQGREILLKGAIKTQSVKSGYAGLWMRIDGEGQSIAFDNMQKRGIKGTTDWNQYTIKLNYDSDQAKSIHIGGLLVGDGKAWFDDFELYIDGKLIDVVAEKVPVWTKASADTAFNSGSGLNVISINARTKANLVMAGQFWSFVKYHHPAIAKGEYNWDAELFRHLPQVIAAKNNGDLSKTLERWIDAMPAPGAVSSTAKKSSEVKVAISPDYGSLFDEKILSESLIGKLNAVKLSERSEKHYYLSFVKGVGNPKFENELPYTKMKYPDAGYRLLCLYRYWAMINYFFPYKDVMDKDWNEVLNNSVAPFANAKNEEDYALETLKLIATVQDTHANIFSGVPALVNFKGKYKMPFNAGFIEDRLVVTSFPYGDTLQVKQKLKIGDVITTINGKPVEKLIEYYLPYTAASNYDTQLRDMPYHFLLRGNSEKFTIGIKDGNVVHDRTLDAIPVQTGHTVAPYHDKVAYKLLNQNIGYVFPAKYKNKDLPAIKELFKNTRGMIIDLRCYPSEFMPFTFGSYIKGKSTPFVKFSRGELSLPGLFTYSSALNNGGGGDSYQGKIVVIVNSSTQSQAEYTTMAFQSDPNVTVIGSTTSGADGNVSTIILPGGISTMISGIGVFYPDGTPTQRIGVKIDQVMKPTIKGISEGRDELLAAAEQIINQ
jgi:C-terminal processing protease CtpA/Prc